jgi:hypothetical protein
MRELTNNELSQLREKLFSNECPICKRPTDLKEMSLDHIHGAHKSIYPETNKLCRELICRDCNVLIGKIENQFLRSSKEIKTQIKLPELLIRISEYIKKYSKIENFNEQLIHPSEWSIKKVKKSWFNKLNKFYKQRKGKDLKYPASGKLTKELEKWSDEFNLTPEFY